MIKIINYDYLYKRAVDERLVNLRYYNSRAGTDFTTIEHATAHYLEYGIQIGLDPNPLFSNEFYQSRYSGQIPRAITPFEHYLSIGEKVSNDPHPIINAAWVSRRLKDLGSKENVLAALLHKCAHYSLDPNPCFSVEFYLNKNPKIRAQRVHPIFHYLDTGAKQALRTHPLFWPEWMTKQAKTPYTISLINYMHDKKLHAQPPNPYFSPDAFVGSEISGANAPLHTYLAQWQQISISPHPSFDLTWFRENFALQLSLTGQDPLGFVLQQGLHQIPINATDGRLTPLYAITEQKHRAVNSAPLRIAFFSHNLRFQGAQNSLFELIRELKTRRNVDPFVFAPDDGSLKSAYEAAGIPVVKYALPVAGLDDEKHYDNLFNRLSAQIKAIDPDIVHCNTIQTFAGIAAACELNIPTIWNIRESEDISVHTQSLKSVAKEKFKIAMSNATRFVFVSKTTADKYVEQLPEINFDVIHNGIDYNRLISMSPLSSRSYARAVRGYKTSDIVFFNVGTWTERKGQIDILRALEHLDRRIWPNIRILLIGANESTYSHEVAEIYLRLPKSLRQNVRIEPETKSSMERSHVVDAFLASDVFLFTSRIESYPRVVNEAMYFSLPIISTPCFGVQEQMRDGQEGVFYEAGDTEQLAKHMEMMYVDEVSRQTFAANSGYSARFVVDQYDDMVRGYLRSYRCVLS